MVIGRIEIVVIVSEDGDMRIHHSCSGDLPVVTKLGVLEMTKDTILNGPEDEE